MEGLSIELSFRPFRKAGKYVSLRVVYVLPSGTMRWLREIEAKVLVRTHAHQEDAATILCNAIVLGIEHRPLHSITSRPIAGKLIAQQVAVLAKHHSIDIFYYESRRKNVAQDTVEFPVEVISVVSLPLSLAPLRIALTGVAANQKMCSFEFAEVANVPALNIRVRYILFVGITGSLPNVVRPDDLVPELLQSVVGSATPAKE